MQRYVAPSTTSIPRAARSHLELRSRELPDLDPYTESVLSNIAPEEAPTLDQLKRTASQLRDLQREHVRRADYEAARSACYALRTVSQAVRAQSTLNSDKADIEQLISKRNELIALVRSTTDSWNGLLDAHAAETRSRLGLLADAQQEELSGFDSALPTDLPPLLKRNSVAYRDMRSKQHYLAVAERFDEAMALQRVADRVAAHEREANFEKMEAIGRKRRRRLEEHHERVMSSVVDYAVLKRDEMVFERDRAVRGQQNRIEGLERQIVAKCEQKGITQGEIRLDLVDEQRIALVRKTEDTNPVSPQQSAAARNASRKRTSDSQCDQRRTATAARREPKRHEPERREEEEAAGETPATPEEEDVGKPIVGD
jgi:hypothetical protein